MTRAQWVKLGAVALILNEIRGIATVALILAQWWK